MRNNFFILIVGILFLLLGCSSPTDEQGTPPTPSSQKEHVSGADDAAEIETQQPLQANETHVSGSEDPSHVSGN